MIRIFFIGMLCSFIGCSDINFSESDLHGSWQAVQLTEGQDTFAYDISQVQLQFNAERKYAFNGNLKNREAGNYYVIGKILYTTDTLVNTKREKAVEIVNLGQDSLELLMNEAGKIRKLKMIRKK